MNIDKDFKIAFSGLPLGPSDFKFNVTDKFFECFNYGEIKKGCIDIDIVLIKEESMLVLEFQLSGIIEIICDRCAHPLEYKANGNNRLIVKFSERDLSNNDEIVILKKNDGILNLAQNIYEFIHLLIPPKRLHKKGGCNQVVMNKLNMLKERKNFVNGDPRWEGLKNLNINN